MLENFKDLYEVRKTVRFELKPYKKTRELLKWENNYQSLDSYIKHIKDWEFEDWFDWNDFCLWKYEDFLKESKKYYWFLLQINGEIEKWKNDTTKKNIYFDFKKSKGIFKNIPSLRKIENFEKLKEKLEEIENMYSSYLNFFDSLKEEKEPAKKKSDISKNLRNIAYLNRNCITIFKFLDEYKTNKDIFEECQNLQNWEFEKLNNTIIASHENEKTWACFWKFTFNKFALFRREDSKLRENFENNKELTNKTVSKMIENKDIKDDRWEIIEINIDKIINLNLEKQNEELQTRLKNFNFERSIDEVISELDNINGILLNQYIQEFTDKYKEDKNIIEVEFLDKEWKKIFNKSEEDKNQKTNISKFYPSIKKLNWEIYDKCEKRNWIKIQPKQTLEWYQYLELLLQDEINDEDKENKKLVNKFLQIIFKQKFINKDYNTIKDFRDKLAKYRWKLRQNVRTSEREFIQESMIRYYGNILEKDWSYFLALTEKDKIENKNIYDIEINKFLSNNTWNYFKIYKYSQLSFWALEKLCLSEEWNLLKNKDLLKKWNKYKYQKQDISDNNFLNNFKDHIKKSIKHLKDANNWSEFINEINKKNSIEEVVNFINKNFYNLVESQIEEDKLFKLADNWDILLFQIYNKDFNILDNRFLSNEEELLTPEEKKKNYDEAFKVKEKTKRGTWKTENLFTLYFKKIFEKNSNKYLWQEWWIFFRKAKTESEKKRFRNNKFLGSFDIIFNKWDQNHNSKLCEKKNIIQDNHLKNTTLNYFNKKIKQNEIIILWIDRWSINKDINKNNEISMIGYCIIKLEKWSNWYVCKDIVNIGDIYKLQRKISKNKNWNWEILAKLYGDKEEDKTKYINFKDILSNLKEEIEKEYSKKWKRELIKIIEKKKWLTGLLINKVINLIIKYNVDYVALENMDNIFSEDKTFKKEMEENTLSAYLYQNFETQLLNKLKYIYLKNPELDWIQTFPNYKVDEIKKIKSEKWFNKKNWTNNNQNKGQENKIIWNIIFVKTAGTSRTCFNCDWEIKKHKLTCKNCWIKTNERGNKLDLKEYEEDFISKDILEKQNLGLFNNDVRAWLVIAKRALKYLEYLDNDETK